MKINNTFSFDPYSSSKKNAAVNNSVVIDHPFQYTARDIKLRESVGHS